MQHITSPLVPAYNFREDWAGIDVAVAAVLHL